MSSHLPFFQNHQFVLSSVSKNRQREIGIFHDSPYQSNVGKLTTPKSIICMEMWMDHFIFGAKYVKFRLKKFSIDIDQLWNKYHVTVFNHWISEKMLWIQIFGAICTYWDMSPRVVKGNYSYNSVHIKSNSRTDPKERHKIFIHLFFVILEHITMC